MRKYSGLFFILIFIFIISGTVQASAEDVTLIPLSRYHANKSCYGFYKMCGQSAWVGMVFHNGSNQDYTISFPSSLKTIGSDGSDHPIGNLRYLEVSSDITSFEGDIEHQVEKGLGGTKFNKSFTLPANKTYAAFLDFYNIDNISNKWNDDVSFNVTVSGNSESTSLTVTGPISQRGTDCPADQSLTASVLSGSYAADGSGSVTILVENNMPMAANVSGLTHVTVSRTDQSGIKQTQEIENAVVWDQNPGSMGTGDKKTVTGTLDLPESITSSSRELDTVFHFYFPSSLFFGDDIQAKGTIYSRSDLYGVLSGSFDTDGKHGSFTVDLNNNQNQTVSVSLPASGTVKDSTGKSSTVSLKWNQTNIKINPKGSTTLTGSFAFNETSLIHNNTSLVLSILFKAGSITGTVSGVVTRNADPNPVIEAGAFCRDLSKNGKKLTFRYVLISKANIDIPVELAGTLAVPGQSPNPKISYTNCMSGGYSCKSRINQNNFILYAGETAAFTGEVDLTGSVSSDVTAETSLRYFPDGKTAVLYIGKAVSSCTKPDQGSATPIPDNGTIKSELFCRSAVSENSISISYALINDNDVDIPVQLAKTLKVEKQSGNLPINYHAKKGLTGYDYILKPKETAVFIGDVILERSDLPLNFAVYMSLEYTADGISKVLDLGQTTTTCSITKNINEVHSTVAPGKDSVNLEIQISNDGSDDAVVTPGNIYFPQEALDAYSGTVSIKSLSGTEEERIPEQFSAGQEIILPERSSALFSVKINTNMSEAYASSADVNWHFDLNNEHFNYTGIIDFAQKNIPVQGLTTVSAMNNALNFYSMAQPQIPEKLPATGFPTHTSNNASGTHFGIEHYKDLNGMRLEIPTINTGMELVQIPLDENGEWRVDALSDRGGVLNTGVLPGEGTSFIAGHNHLDAMNAGPFLMLPQLKENDRLYITDSQGKMLAFSVYANVLMNPSDGALISQKAIPGSLVLMTCESEMPEGGYAYRRVVFAEPLQ